MTRAARVCRAKAGAHSGVHGGPTSLGNLILLCGHHHRLIHSGGPWQIRVTAPGVFEFDPPPGVRRAGRPPPDG